ncbi:hypothetical protein [Pectobacterium brasiliense]|nr:hypothetical protein [Pectobacterium brasiliense]MBN3264443.1 hypothetical protein [Pectobacterium brasiliense]
MIGRDRIYLIALLCSILCYLVSAQIESTLPQYLLALDSARGGDLSR